MNQFKSILDQFTRSEDDDEPEEALGPANVDAAGEGIGVCRTTPWTEFSPCSATCGIGISMRTRSFVDHAGRKKCPHITIGNYLTFLNAQIFFVEQFK